MTITIKRLAPGDEPILQTLAAEDADFDLDGRSEPLKPLTAEQAHRYLSDPAVLNWAAMDGDTLLGFLYCLVVPLRSDDAQELLLYEIGVRSQWRRKGVGRALLDHMERWMKENAIKTVWVLADNPTAVDFYRGCGFGVEDEQPVYLTR
ncbi:MAG: GCN5-related N-acetyltransferase [Cyanobacteria bacterium RYN_339]|nr:GCN5-related N-acetyltransferase [Cyanobacteria bacterium RYN_339]